MLLDIVKESSDAFLSLESCLGRIKAWIKHDELHRCEGVPNSVGTRKQQYNDAKDKLDDITSWAKKLLVSLAKANPNATGSYRSGLRISMGVASVGIIFERGQPQNGLFVVGGHPGKASEAVISLKSNRIRYRATSRTEEKPRLTAVTGPQSTPRRITMRQADAQTEQPRAEQIDAKLTVAVILSICTMATSGTPN
jgi:hypothetical protein